MADTTSDSTSLPSPAPTTDKDGTIQNKWLIAVRGDVRSMLDHVERKFRDEQSHCNTREEMDDMCSGLEDIRFNGQTDDPPTTHLEKPLHAMSQGVWKSVTDALKGQREKKCWRGFFDDTSEMEIKTGPQSVELRIEPSGRFFQRNLPDKTEYVQTCQECTVTGKPVKVVGTWMGTTMDGDSGLKAPGHWDWGTVIEPDETEASTMAKTPGSHRSKAISNLTNGLRRVLCVK